MLATLFVIALAIHGVGHVLFVANSWGYWQSAGTHASLFSGLGQIGEGILRLAWLVSLAGFLLGTAGLISHQTSATTLLVGSAVASSISIVLWWSDLVTGSAFFALVFNVLVIAVLLWRPEAVGAPGT